MTVLYWLKQSCHFCFEIARVYLRHGLVIAVRRLSTMAAAAMSAATRHAPIGCGEGEWLGPAASIALATKGVRLCRIEPGTTVASNV